MPHYYPLKFGKYILTRRISVGGMAEVFKAKLVGPKGFEKTLAVKKILPEFVEDEEFIQMFVDEARISSNLVHPNIIQVFDFGEVDSSFYIAMEFVDGPNFKNLLQRHIKDKGRFPQSLSLYVGIQIAKALEYAHNVRIDDYDILNIVHRDISPQNILISRSGEVKITDFGIAKAKIKLSQTQPGKIQGKLSYMSPEQAMGQSLDHRSDIFSLGIVLYEALSGIKLYAADNTSKKFAQIREAQIPRLAMLVPEMPSQLESLVMRMLAKEPEDRPQHAQEVIKELIQVMGNAAMGGLATELGNLIEELFPQEKSDSSMGRRVQALLQENQAANEPHTEVSMDRLPSSFSTDGSLDGMQLSPKKPEGLFSYLIQLKTLLNTIPVRHYVIFAFGFILLAGIVWIYMKKESSFVEQPSLVDISPTDVENQPGPIDPDIRDAALARQKEVEIKLHSLEQQIQLEREQSEKTTKELEEKIRITEEKVTKTEKELEQAKKKLKSVAGVKKRQCPKDMIYIAAGSFLFGSQRNDKNRNALIEFEEKKVETRAFCIDPYEYPNLKGQLPITMISWEKAQALCKNIEKRLCTQEEWERACKGKSIHNNQQYPYGMTWKIEACNTRGLDVFGENTNKELAPSGSFAQCISPDGIYDMSGNADEWTASQGRFAKGKRIVKGGSSFRPKFQVRCSSLRETDMITSKKDIGFRCCKNAN